MLWKSALLEEILGPDDAVNGLRRCVSYGASWESLLGGLRLTLVAFCHSLENKDREEKKGDRDRDTVRGRIVAALQSFTG